MSHIMGVMGAMRLLATLDEGTPADPFAPVLESLPRGQRALDASHEGTDDEEWMPSENECEQCGVELGLGSGKVERARGAARICKSCAFGLNATTAEHDRITEVANRPLPWEID